MSRAKKGVASEGQVPVQKEAAESPSSIEQLLKAMEKCRSRWTRRFRDLKKDRIN